MHLKSENEYQETDSEIVSDENIVLRSKTEAGRIIACQDHQEAFSIFKQSSLVIKFVGDY